MSMKRIAGVIIAVVCICMILCGCTRVVRSSSDELRMFRWGTTMENGNHLELVLDDETAAFTAVNDAFSLRISGGYDVNDTSLVIYDEATHMSFRFDYTLHGDGVELSYRDVTVLLEKNDL